MARNWIKIETATADKTEICVMATQLKMDPDAVLGKLVRMWSWAEVNRINGSHVSVTKEFLDKVVGKKGFSNALELAGWLREGNGGLQFINFSKHNGPTGKGRALTAQRVSRHRDKYRNSNVKLTPSTTGEDLERVAFEAEKIQVKRPKGVDNDSPKQVEDSALAVENIKITEIDNSREEAVDLAAVQVVEPVGAAANQDELSRHEERIEDAEFEKELTSETTDADAIKELTCNDNEAVSDDAKEEASAQEAEATALKAKPAGGGGRRGNAKDSPDQPLLF